MEARLEQLEMAMDVANEVLVEKLVEFENRISSLERDHDSDISSIRNELKDLSRSGIADPDMLTSTPKAIGRGRPSTSGEPVIMKHGLEPLTCVPITIDDVQVDEVKEAIRRYVPFGLDPKEKLSPAQYGYVLYWLNERKPETGRKCHALRLREDGIKDKMWGPRWSPDDISSDFESYLLDKIKAFLRKQKKASLKLSLKRKVEEGQN